MKKKILLVEDEEIVQRLCRRLLGRGDYELTMAGTVGEAEASLKRGAPDLLITDLRLPDGHGVDVIRSLRSLSPEARIIVITGSLTPEDRLYKESHLGIDECICKPFEIEELQAAIQRCLDRRDGADGAPEEKLFP